MVAPGSPRWVRPAPALVVALAAALVASLVILGQPSRPATATIVRPIVTVPSLCSAPTVVDVAARDATRSLTAVGQLLGSDDELVVGAARDLSIVDTDAGTFFVLARGGQLRVAALSPAGLPILNAELEPPQTYRAFALDEELAERRPLVVNGSEGVFVVIGGDDAPVRVLALTPSTLASSDGLQLATDPLAPEIADPASRPGAAVVRDGVLWLAGDDGNVVSFDPLAEGAERWTERADGALAALLARGDDSVLALFPSDATDADVEIRAFRADGDPVVTPVRTAIRVVTAVTYPDSAVPAFTVITDDGAGLLRPDGGPGTPHGDPSVVAIPGVGGDLLGVVATDGAAALLTATTDGLRYRVVDAAGAEVGAFTATDDERCVDGGWPDAATTTQPSSAGRLLHLHDPSGPRDCVVDGQDAAGLAEVTSRCAPGGVWAVDKGSAPARDFTVEVGRAFDELEADAIEERATPEALTPRSAIQEELGTSGIEVVDSSQAETDPEGAEGAEGVVAGTEGVVERAEGVVEGDAEVDPEAADACAAEVVQAVAPPVLDLAAPVGSRAIRVEWSWSGGECLPGRYLVTLCLLAEQGSACAESTDTSVTGSTTSARSALQLSARPDRTYRITVRAVKGPVVSVPSGALLVRTPAVTPDPPTAVSATLRGGTWSLGWSSCLAAGDCDQRPDGFVVTVEGCGGDGLGQRARRFDASSRGTSFGAEGAGFGGADLLGRTVQFRVATTSGDRVSEPVAAGSCTSSVRPGRDATASAFGVSLTGRGRQISVAPIAGGRALTELFGTAGYDDVSVRLLRSGTPFGPRTGVLSRAVTFEVDRCAADGWTVELTPRSSGRDLTAHRAQLTGAGVACDPTVDGSTRIDVAYTGGSSAGLDLRITIPGLGQDTANGLVGGVTARATCTTAFGGSDTTTLSGSSTSGDDVAFRTDVPAILDLRRGCEVQPVVAFTGGGSASPAGRPVDLDRAARVIVERVIGVAADRLERARTGRYEGRRAGIIGLGGQLDVVSVRHDGSGVPCNRTFGTSTWRFEVLGTRSYGCADGAHALVFEEGDLDAAGRGQLQVRASVLGTGEATATVARTVPVCQLPDGSAQPPCVPPPDPCAFDSSIPEDDPACPDPCPWDPDLPVSDPGCVAPVEPCPTDPDLPVDDPACDPEPDPEPDPGPDPGPAPGPDPGPDPEAAPPEASPPAAAPTRTARHLDPSVHLGTPVHLVTSGHVGRGGR